MRILGMRLIEVTTILRGKQQRNMDSLKTKMENLSEWLKALGDRYVFYQRLVETKKKEENASRAIDINYRRPFNYNI